MAPKTEARWPSSSVPSYKTLDFGLLDMVRGGNPTCPLPQTALRPLPTRPSEKMDNKHLDNGFQKGIGKAVDSGTSDSAAAVDEARWIEVSSTRTIYRGPNRLIEFSEE